MCGICGWVELGSAAPDPGVVRAMTETLRHRGPDDGGLAALGPAVLGHRRLSIIDLSDAGRQPMQTPDGRYTLVYNGEVYNFEELRSELQSAGVRFTSRSDSEVVLRAFERWGTRCLRRLHGMFALAIWDAQERALHLARDRFGIKPLYYARTDGGLVFGSEIKALLASGRIEPDIDPQALHEYLYFGNPLGERTLYASVRELLPGHHLRLDARGETIEAFWKLEEVAPCRDDLETATRRVRELLEASVRRHLISDVPVGVFLSGGTDSSSIVAFASRHAGRIATFSVGFDFAGNNDELPLARRVAERFGTDHHELHLTAGNLREVIEALVRCHDEPFADAANVPLYLLCRDLAGSLKVVLQGDGGDEMFAGYRRYRMLRLRALWWLAARGLEPFASLLQRRTLTNRLLRMARAVGATDSARRMALLLTLEAPEESPLRILHPELRAQVAATDPFLRYRELDRRLAHLEPVQRMLHTDAAIILPDTFLEKVDKSTMAHGIEVRVPYLDAELAEYAMSLPASWKARTRQGKWIVRRALRGIVPDEVLDGPKRGFGVPYSQWLRKPLSDWLRAVLTDSATQRARLFEPVALQQAIDLHLSGRRDLGFLLYKALVLALWHQNLPSRARSAAA
jgi:asparagine synthase (glutamine-hydrolysing)